MEFLIVVIQVIFWLAIIFCCAFTFIFLNMVLTNLREQKTVERVKEELTESMMVYTEKVGNTIHMYDVLSGFFIAQGSTEEEVWERARTRCPDMNLILTTVNKSANTTISTSTIKEQK